jgi:hypothetical protein
MLATSAREMSAQYAPVRREIRFTIVMYCGVSLAIYENGIALEFLNLVRSTARKSGFAGISVCREKPLPRRR